MMREMGVQMDVGLGRQCEITGLFMDTRNDKIITPNKNYFSSKMWAKEREDTKTKMRCKQKSGQRSNNKIITSTGANPVQNNQRKLEKRQKQNY